MTPIETIQASLDRLERITLLGAKNVLTISETSLLTGLSVNYIYQLTSTQKIPHYKRTGKSLYFKKDEIESWMLSNKIMTTDETEMIAAEYTRKNKKTFKN